MKMPSLGKRNAIGRTLDRNAARMEECPDVADSSVANDAPGERRMAGSDAAEVFWQSDVLHPEQSVFDLRW